MKTSIFTNSNECIAETVFPGDHSRVEPPDPISNSEVKHTSADDSVGFPHVKVGHCQDFNKNLKANVMLALSSYRWRSSVGRATDL